MAVVVSWPQHLAARQIFIDRRDAAFDAHRPGRQWRALRQAWQRGAIGTQQKDRLDQIAAGLFNRQRRQFRIVNPAFGHHPIHRQSQLLRHLIAAEFGYRPIAAPQIGLQLMGVRNGFFAPFHRDIHQHTSTTVVRGTAMIASPQVKIRSTPCGNGCGRVRKYSSTLSGSCGAMARVSRRPGPERRSVRPPFSDGTSIISVVLFSGDILSPAANCVGSGCAAAWLRAKGASCCVVIGAPVWKRRLLRSCSLSISASSQTGLS